MLLKAVIALKLTEELPEVEADYIGADKGALVLAQKKIRMKFAIGDFDSVTEEDIALIREYADEVIQLNPIKDDSDSEAAMLEAFRRGYGQVWMTGALGGRIDHEYVNLRLAAKYPGRVILWDRRNQISAFDQGTWVFEQGEYTYFSVFPQPEAVISLKGFAYPLQDRRITYDDLYTVSNEITEEQGIMIVHEGIVTVMRTKD